MPASQNSRFEKQIGSASSHQKQVKTLFFKEILVFDLYYYFRTATNGLKTFVLPVRKKGKWNYNRNL